MKAKPILSFILIKKLAIPSSHHLFPLLLLTTLWLFSCNKDESVTQNPTPLLNQPKITSEEFKDDLLFVNRGNFQIQTSDSATFSSSDPKIQISPKGLIKRITSAEVVAIDVNWVNQPEIKTRIYALGATDSSFDEPYASFHGRHATDAFAAYQQGWKTLQKLPVMGETYAIILRHADANNGLDFSKTTGPPNWWTSCDSTMARQLNTQGKQRATELGKIFKDLHFPITRVISSEFCRAITTAQLINAGPIISIDKRLNHYSYNVTGLTMFAAMIAVMNEQPVDNAITLIVSHHPINEKEGYPGYLSFPDISPFTWSAAYFIKIAPDKTITYEGAASWGMFKYWRDKKLNL